MKSFYLVKNVFHATTFTKCRFYRPCPVLLNDKKVNINFKFSNGTIDTVFAKVGDSLLDVVIDNKVDIDGFGACDGTLSCSTCHLIFKKEDYEKLPNKPSEEEMDMLDLAFGLTDTSRLGCQIIVSKDLQGIEIEVPASNADARDV